MPFDRQHKDYRKVLTGKKQDFLFKGQCHEILCFWFFPWISFPQAPEYTIRAVSNFFNNSRRYLQLKVEHRYQRHRRQILPPVSVVLLIPVANLPPVSTIPYRRQIGRRCQRHRWQIATGINDTGGKFATGVADTVRLITDWGYFKVNLKAKINIYINSTIHRWPNKIIKNFQIEDFSHLPTV